MKENKQKNGVMQYTAMKDKSGGRRHETKKGSIGSVLQQLLGIIYSHSIWGLDLGVEEACDVRNCPGTFQNIQAVFLQGYYENQFYSI